MTPEIAPPRRPLWFYIGRNLLFGIVVCLFSLNGLLSYLAARWSETKIGGALSSLAAVPQGIYDHLPGGPYFLLELLFRWVILSTVVFVVLLALSALRHQSATILLTGIAGLFAGLFALTWISLIIFIVIIVLAIAAWIFNLIQVILSAIFSFLTWWPVFYSLVGIGTIIGVALLVILISGISWQDTLNKLKLKPLLIGGAVLIAIGVIWLVVVPLWRAYVSPLLAAIGRWLGEYVVPVLSWILTAIVALILLILAVGLGLGALLVLGFQYCDQFAAARVCGRSTHRSFDAGFGIGAVMAVMFLVCSANSDYRAVINASWSSTVPILSEMDIVGAVSILMPHTAETLLQSLFAKAAMPIFDAGSLILVLFLANCSLLMGLLSGVSVEPMRGLFNKDRMPPLFKLVFGIFVALTVNLVDSVISQDS